MAISNLQLNTWSHQGSITNSADTANSIKYALNNNLKVPNGVTYEVYLSGSYKNDTNVYGESDVDTVVELTSSFYHNLNEPEKQNFGFISAEYGYFDFKQAVIKCLNDYYGEKHIDVGSKAIKIYPPNSNRLHADVLVCSTYRLYTDRSKETAYIKGVAFYIKNSLTRVINFPRRHSDNDTVKHQATASRFKPTVRIIKNMRNRLVANGAFTKKKAPSYFIECLLYNVPNVNFVSDNSTTIYNVLLYLNNSNWDSFICTNGITPLWGSSTETWDQTSAREFLAALIKLWNDN